MKWIKHYISDTILTRLLSAFCKMAIVVLTARYFGADGRGLIGILTYSMTLLMLLSEFVGGSSLITLVPSHSMKNLVYPSYLWSTLVWLLFIAFFSRGAKCNSFIHIGLVLVVGVYNNQLFSINRKDSIEMAKLGSILYCSNYISLFIAESGMARNRGD